MSRASLPWAVALFFGCTIAFATIHRLTRHQSNAVAAVAQVAALAVIVAAVVLVARRLDDDR